MQEKALRGLARDDNGKRWKRRDEASAAPFDRKPEFPQLPRIFAGEFVVGEEGGSPGFEHPRNLLDGPTPGRAVVDIVQTEVGYDEIETGVGEGHLLSRLTYQGAEPGNTF